MKQKEKQWSKLVRKFWRNFDFGPILNDPAQLNYFMELIIFGDLPQSIILGNTSYYPKFRFLPTDAGFARRRGILRYSWDFACFALLHNLPTSQSEFSVYNYQRAH